MVLSVDIEKTLGDFHLRVRFAAEREIMALLGASGCGKSMTLKCIAGIQRPDRGRIVLGDRVLFDSEAGINLPPQKRHVGYLFQQYALFPNMTVEQNILAGARGGTVIHARATDAENANKFFGMAISEEREMIFLVTSSDKRADIMKSIMEKAGAHTDAQTVTFSVPLDDTAGLYSTEN